MKYHVSDTHRFCSNNILWLVFSLVKRISVLVDILADQSFIYNIKQHIATLQFPYTRT